MKNSSNLANGITGITIGKRTIDNRALTAKNRVKDRLPTLKGHCRRKYQSDDVNIKITIKNRLMRRYNDGRKGAPIECFKVTSFKSKNHK